MCFSPATETTMLVTTAKDGQFKVWLLGSDPDTQSEFHHPRPRLGYTPHLCVKELQDEKLVIAVGIICIIGRYTVVM